MSTFTDEFERRRAKLVEMLSAEDLNSSRARRIRRLIKELEEYVVPSDLEEKQQYDEACPSLGMAKVERMMALVYFSFLLSKDNLEDLKFLKHYQESERLRAIICNPNIQQADLDAISLMARAISEPAQHTHKLALDHCGKSFKRWLAKSYIHSDENPNYYGNLKRSIEMIVGSSFFENPVPAYVDTQVYNKEDYTMELTDWIAQNTSLTSVEVRGFDSPPFRRLTDDARLILRKILKRLKHLHECDLYCEELKMENIFLREDKDVMLDVKLISHTERSKNGNIRADFRGLRRIVRLLIGDVPLDAPEFPPDLKDWMMILLHPLSVKAQFMIFNHPCIWSTVENIKNILLFKQLYCSSNDIGRGDITKALTAVPSQELPHMFVQYEWVSKIPTGSKYEAFYYHGVRNYMMEPVELGNLFFMRDVFPHLRDVLGNDQPLELTERELYAIFPTYLSFFVRATCHLEALARIISY